MSQIIFYTTNVESKINTFLDSIKEEPEKINHFLTFEQISSRTKVTLDSPASQIVTTIITMTSILNDLVVFIPWMSLIRGELKSYIETNNIDNISYTVIMDEENDAELSSNIKKLSGENDNQFVRIPSEFKFEYEQFFSTEKKIMYVLSTNKAEEIRKELTQNSRIQFTEDFGDVVTNFGLSTDDTILVACPQLQTVTWFEMNKVLESSFTADMVDCIYCELDENEQPDFFMSLIMDFATKYESIRVSTGKSVIKIVDVPDEDNNENTSSNEEINKDEIPTVEAEQIGKEN